MAKKKAVKKKKKRRQRTSSQKAPEFEKRLLVEKLIPCDLDEVKLEKLRSKGLDISHYSYSDEWPLYLLVGPVEDVVANLQAIRETYPEHSSVSIDLDILERDSEYYEYAGEVVKLAVTGMRLETDEEFEKRKARTLKRRAQDKERRAKQKAESEAAAKKAEKDRYQQYLTLKKEFEEED